MILTSMAGVHSIRPQGTMLAQNGGRLLFQKLFEPEKDWFAKRGVSLHGLMFLFEKEENGKLFTEFHDLYSQSDDKQNWYLNVHHHSGPTVEPTTKRLHLCYGCLIFLHLQGYRFQFQKL